MFTFKFNFKIELGKKSMDILFFGGIDKAVLTKIVSSTMYYQIFIVSQIYTFKFLL